MTHALELFGRLHPLLLHLPVGLLPGALLLEVVASRNKLDRRSFGVYLRVTACLAALTAAAGWVLAHEEGYGGETLERHEKLGLALSALALAASLAHDPAGRSQLRLLLSRVFLVASCVLLVPAGHLGSTMTHGVDWLEGPRAPAVTARADAANGAGEAAAVPGKGAAEPELYADVVAPILGARCTSCHGAKKRKGGLRLDSPAAIQAGGEDGPVLVPGDVAASAFLVRARLPLEHEDHMPPEGKPQPTAEELAALERWVAAGAPFGAGAGAPAVAEVADDEARAEEERERAEAEKEKQRAAQERAEKEAAARERQKALAALDEAFVHHELLRGEAQELVIDVAAVAPSFGDAELERLIVPLAADVVSLGLARSAVGDPSLAKLARFPALVRLDLRATRISDAGLAALAAHPHLEQLVLAQTPLTDASVDVLLGLPKLTSVALWKTGLSADGLARLRARPGLKVNAGDEPPAEALESEGELAFTSDRALPGAELVPEGLRPVNATCPVSGSPVNPKYSVLHDGRVVGFCCPNCPKEFWADPAKFASKLP